MAIAITTLTSAYDGTDASSYVTASVNPGGGVLLLTVLSRHSTGSSNLWPNSITGLGQTWTLALGTGQAPSNANQAVRLALYWASGASPTNGTVTIGFAGTILSAGWVLNEVTGSDPTAPIVQFVTENTVTSNSETIALAALADANNASFGAFGMAANEQTTAGSGYTKEPSTNPAGSGPNGAVTTEYLVPGSTTVDLSWTTSSTHCVFGAEIKSGAAATNAPGGNAAGTGAANAGGKTLKPNSAASTGTGAAATAGPHVKVSGGHASGSGDAVTSISATLYAGIGFSAGTSTAYVAEGDVSTSVFPSAATGTGAAYVAAMSLQSNAAAALGTETLASLVTDAFGRSVSSGLGTADSGQTWTATGTASDYNVASGAATFGHTAVTQARRAWLPSVVTHDVDHTIKWKGPLPTTSEHNVFIQLRQTSADGDYLMPRLVVNTDLSMNLALMRRAVAVETVLASATLPNTFQADTYYSIRTRLMGQGYFGKVWKSSDTEPTNWQVVVTETQLVAPGGIGMRTYSPSASYPITYSFDDLSVSEIRGNQAYNPTITASSLVQAFAIAAAGTGSVNTSTGTISLPSAAATGTGAAATTSSDVQASVAYSAGTGAAYGSASSFLAYAGLPAGTGAAGSLSSLVSFPAFTAEGSGDATNTLSFSVAASEVAQGVGQAFDTTTVPISSFSGFGTLTYRSAGAVLTFGGR